MSKLRAVWILLSAVGLASACNRQEPLPVYVDLREVKVQPFQNSSVSGDLGARTVWLFQGDELVGAFPSGSIVPVVPNGRGKLLAIGGILESGLSSLRSPYPFWIPQDIILPDEPLDTVRPGLTFPYYPDTVVVFPFTEGFEQANLNITSTETGSDAARIRTQSNGALFGTGAGRVVFTENEYIFEVSTSQFLTLPQTGNNPIYAEISFRGSNVAFTTGLFFLNSANAGDIPAGIFFPADSQWTTVYINLTDLVRQTPQSTQFKWYIRAENYDANLQKGRPGELWLDNLRIVRYR